MSESDLFSAESDNIRKQASRMEYAEFDRKMEKHFRSHPELKPGRDFRANTLRFQAVGDEIGRRFDKTFAGSPDSPDWWNKEFCSGCDRRKTLCRCRK